jgi:hypothetical protein
MGHSWVAYTWVTELTCSKWQLHSQNWELEYHLMVKTLLMWSVTSETWGLVGYMLMYQVRLFESPRSVTILGYLFGLLGCPLRITGVSRRAKEGWHRISWECNIRWLAGDWRHPHISADNFPYMDIKYLAWTSFSLFEKCFRKKYKLIRSAKTTNSVPLILGVTIGNYF